MEHDTKEKNTKSNPYAIPVAIILAGALVAAALFFGGKSNNANPTAAAPTQGTTGQQAPTQAVDASKVNTTNEPYVGSLNAPVTMAVWTDYQCPFCQRFEADSIDQLYTNYVQTGKLRIIFKDYAFLGPDSETTAIIARAVWEADPTDFYKWRTFIYQNQGAEGSSWATQDKILAMTSAILGASEEQKIAALVASKSTQYQAAVDADKAEGVSFGVQGTPGSIIGTQFINGDQPYVDVKAAVDQALAGK